MGGSTRLRLRPVATQLVLRTFSASSNTTDSIAKKIKSSDTIDNHGMRSEDGGDKRYSPISEVVKSQKLCPIPVRVPASLAHLGPRNQPRLVQKLSRKAGSNAAFVINTATIGGGNHNNLISIQTSSLCLCLGCIPTLLCENTNNRGMEQDRLETNLGPILGQDDFTPDIEPTVQKPRRRFVGRRTAEAQQAAAVQTNGANGNIEDSNAIQGVCAPSIVSIV